MGPQAWTMEAIKKKMQAMKVEKDNLMDRCDNCEQVSWDYFLILLNSVFNIDNRHVSCQKDLECCFTTPQGAWEAILDF